MPGGNQKLGHRPGEVDGKRCVTRGGSDRLRSLPVRIAEAVAKRSQTIHD